MTKQTPLHSAHLNSKATMVDFHGWNMPLQYKGIIAEHENTRQNVSLFDVSHMGEFSVEGDDALNFLNYVTTNDVSKLSDNQAQYSLLLHLDGTVVDDLIVYRFGASKYRLCVNASNIQKDFHWLKQHITDFDVELSDISDQISLIALQGRNAQPLLSRLTNCDLEQIKFYHFLSSKIEEHDVIIARMGYTGEDGFEISCSPDAGLKIWDLLLKSGEDLKAEPAGLGARDILRLEAGLCLYGNELDDQHVVPKSNLSYFIKMNKDNFVGKTALTESIEKGLERKLIAFELTDKGVPRTHQEILNQNEEIIGVVTSGTFSPLLKKGIGMAYVRPDLESGDAIFVKGQRRNTGAIIIQPPFFKRTY